MSGPRPMHAQARKEEYLHSIGGKSSKKKLRLAFQAEKQKADAAMTQARAVQRLLGAYILAQPGQSIRISKQMLDEFNLGSDELTAGRIGSLGDFEVKVKKGEPSEKTG